LSQRPRALIDTRIEDVHSLLRHQLNVLLTRLSIWHGQQQTQTPPVSPASQPFERFQTLLDERFAQWRQVAEYAGELDGVLKRARDPLDGSVFRDGKERRRDARQCLAHWRGQGRIKDRNASSTKEHARGRYRSCGALSSSRVVSIQLIAIQY
jgi:hypothetical protein